MELAKQQLGAKNTQEAREQLKNFANDDTLKAYKYVTVDELHKGGYLQGGKKGFNK